MTAFDTIEKYASWTLLAIPSVVIVAAIPEVAYVVVTDPFRPPGFFIGVEGLFDP